MTQREMALAGRTSPQARDVAASEGVDPEVLRERLAAGRVVIPANPAHRGLTPIGIGEGLRTKVNANIGTSRDCPNMEEELVKLQAAVDAGADTLMDLSTGGDINAVRRAVLDRSPVPVGTVPIYQAAIRAVEESGAVVHLSVDSLFEVIENQAKEGVDFMTVHSGLTREALDRLVMQGRVMDVVSRGGAFLVDWMIYHDKENPLYEHFDRLLELARSYDITLSLGDGLRPGSVADATDRAQIQELIILGELTTRAWEAGVQVMIEGPGHVPIDQIEANVLLEKRICEGAPFYVLGPLVTDIAPGYDHITAAIGGAVAAKAGADFLCYVTPSEHLRLPTPEDVRIGVIATRVAAHAGDIAKGIKGAMDADRALSEARKAQDWEEQIRLSLDPQLAERLRDERRPLDSSTCSMCGEYCAIRLVKEYLHGKGKKGKDT
ncbi:MAG: phosphomethylpyrimidine synthase ThiC [bacterium]